MSIQEQLSIEEAKAIIAGGLGRFELELVTQYCTPLYWALRRNGNVGARNGTAFFLNTGARVVGVTAAHVITEWQASVDRGDDCGPLRLGSGGGISFLLDWDKRKIGIHDDIDIATFAMSEPEVTWLKKLVLTGWQKSWPPKPPQVNCGVYYCGYPGVGTRHPSTGEVVFGAVPGSGVASSVSETDVSSMIERQHLMPVLGDGIPPENFDFGGISGGIMLTVVQNQLRSWALAGVIYEGPHVSDDPNEAIPGLEIIKARRADFILEDGTLDVPRWAAVRP